MGLPRVRGRRSWLLVCAPNASFQCVQFPRTPKSSGSSSHGHAALSAQPEATASLQQPVVCGGVAQPAGPKLWGSEAVCTKSAAPRGFWHSLCAAILSKLLLHNRVRAERRLPFLCFASEVQASGDDVRCKDIRTQVVHCQGFAVDDVGLLPYKHRHEAAGALIGLFARRLGLRAELGLDLLQYPPSIVLTRASWRSDTSPESFDFDFVPCSSESFRSVQALRHPRRFGGQRPACHNADNDAHSLPRAASGVYRRQKLKSERSKDMGCGHSTPKVSLPHGCIVLSTCHEAVPKPQRFTGAPVAPWRGIRTGLQTQLLCAHKDDGLAHLVLPL